MAIYGDFSEVGDDENGGRGENKIIGRCKNLRVSAIHHLCPAGDAGSVSKM